MLVMVSKTAAAPVSRISAAAETRAKISRAGLRWGLVAIVAEHLSMARVAEGLSVSWYTANGAVLAEGRRLLIADRPAWTAST